MSSATKTTGAIAMRGVEDALDLLGPLSLREILCFVGSTEGAVLREIGELKAAGRVYLKRGRWALRKKRASV